LLFPRLVSLDLSRCENRVPAAGQEVAAGAGGPLGALTALTGLRSLSLASWEGLDWRTIFFLRSLPHLCALRLAGCPRVDLAAMQILSPLPRLALLSVAGCRAMSDRAVRAISLSGNLTSLDVRRGPPSEEGLLTVPFLLLLNLSLRLPFLLVFSDCNSS